MGQALSERRGASSDVGASAQVEDLGLVRTAIEEAGLPSRAGARLPPDVRGT